MGLLLGSLGGCDDMSVQPRQNAYSPQAGPAAIPAGTVEFEHREQTAPAITMALLERGQERYRIYCIPCHSELGDGNGMVVQRGFPRPPSYHIDRLRAASSQYLYDVITSGHGVMYSFAERVRPADRWAIVAYIRALQRSQRASPADLSATARDNLK